MDTTSAVEPLKESKKSPVAEIVVRSDSELEQLLLRLEFRRVRILGVNGNLFQLLSRLRTWKQ
jgi:hypothetical protein